MSYLLPHLIQTGFTFLVPAYRGCPLKGCVVVVLAVAVAAVVVTNVTGIVIAH